MKQEGPLNVLVTPLNWGLGHAARSVPVIRVLCKMGHCVHLASDGSALKYLRREFPKLPVHELPALDIHYSYKGFVFPIILQLPYIFKAILADHKATAAIVKELDINLIISDNRYGCFHSATKNILITHQLSISEYGRWYKPAEWALKQMVKQFDQIWVPDSKRAPGYTGLLSRGVDLGQKYIGTLSRFNKSPPANRYKFDAAVILSGPEPQRSIFEKILTGQAADSDLRIALVRGVEFTSQPPIEKPAGWEVCSMADEKQLRHLFHSSRVIICRAGYSSIMDLVNMRKPAILIPTPGQPEQQYLAKHLSGHPGFLIYQQSDFSLGIVKKASSNLSFEGVPEQEPHSLEEALEDVQNNCRRRE